MDLRAMLNTEGGAGGGDRSKGSRPPPPPPPPLPPSSISTSVSSMPSAAPATPIQHGFSRDFTHSTQASPISQPHDYPPHVSHNPPPSAGPAYASPTSYHPSVGTSPYPPQGRPSVPPLQPPLSSHDARSPASATAPGPSPYRQTPTSSASASSSGYPFPPASPNQRHNQFQSYPPHHHRDSYGSQTPVTSVPPYPHHQSVPQTPPVGTPGGSHQYLQQRSMSIQSTPTPTSAHSQHPPFPMPYQKSPIMTHSIAPGHHEPQHHHRHQSPQQAHMVAPRQSPALSYQQPPSPYQTRTSSTPIQYQHPQPQPQPQHHHQQIIQPSPPPPPPASLTRMPSSVHSAYDPKPQRRSQSQQSRGERERTLSVSPKTRVPSLPSSTTDQDQHPASTPSATALATHPHPPQQHSNHPVANMESQQWDGIPAKRKIDDRDLPPDEMENQRQPPPPPKMNGHRVATPSQTASRTSASPVLARKRRVRHAVAPIWAQSGRKRNPGLSRNFGLKNHQGVVAAAPALVNGTKTEHVSRHASPEAVRAPTMPREETTSDGFMWETSIENSEPMDVVSRAVADFLATLTVVKGPNPEDMRARGAQYEIEAKLGTIIDRATNDRLDMRMVRVGECVLGDDARVAFRSSMTESQHRAFNNYLNEQVQATHPQNPSARARLPVKYIHRRETDRFFELPPTMRQRLPAAMANLLSPNAALKVRVTYDQTQKTPQGEKAKPIAMIVKARVADLHIHMPHLPLDCRVSINIEWDWDGTVDEIEQHQIPNKDRQPDRNKDRLSYKHGLYSIDLTQVTQATMGAQGQPGLVSKEHELEIEVDSTALIEQGRLLLNSDPKHHFTDLVNGLLNNLRLLARRCPVTED